MSPWQIDPRRRRQSHDRLLREILRAAADVAGPFVGRSAGIVVDRGEGEFVEPAGDAALGIEKTGRLARAHRDTQHAIFAQGHCSGKRGHVAVVGHLERHTPFPAQVQKQRLDLLLEQVWWHAAKQRRDHHLVIDVNPG